MSLQSVERQRQKHIVCYHSCIRHTAFMPWRHLPSDGRQAGDVTGNSDWRTFCAHARVVRTRNRMIAWAMLPRRVISSPVARRRSDEATALHNCWPARITWPQHTWPVGPGILFQWRRRRSVTMTSRLQQLASISVISIFRHAVQQHCSSI